MQMVAYERVINEGESEHMTPAERLFAVGQEEIRAGGL